MDKNEFLSVVIPAYNEKAGIENTIEVVHRVLKPLGRPYEVIIVNDGSSDGMAELLRGGGDIVLIDRSANRGYGYSLKEGIERAKGEWILITDADGTYPIEDMPVLLSHAAGFDMVVGERSKDQVAMGIFNRTAKAILRVLIYLLTYRWITDINSGFRLFRKELAKKYEDIIPDGFSFTTTITLIAAIEKRGMRYVPINYYKRIGKSHIKPVRDFLSFIILVLRTITFFKPLRFFLPISMIFLAASLLRALRDILAQNYIGTLAGLLFMLAVQSFFFGLLADLIVSKSRMNRK